MQNNQFLGTEKINKLLFQLAVPTITAQLINMLYNLVDRVYIGHIPEIGAQALTGVGVSFPIIIIISAFAALVGSGSAPRASMAMGQKDTDTAEKIMGNSFIILTTIAIFLTVFLSIYNEQILMMFGASENTIKYAVQYVSIYALGTIFVQYTLGMNTFITAQGFAKFSMMTVTIGAVCNIILDPILIFGLNLGVQGAALATIISQGISAMWVISFLTGKKTILKLKRKYFKVDFKLMIPCLMLGMASFIMQVTEGAVSLTFNTSLLKYGGDLAVGSMAILISAMQFTMLPLTGLSQGAQPITSYNFGANNKQRVVDTFKLLLKCCMIYGVVMWSLMMLFPGMFARLFTPDVELIEFTKTSLRIYLLMSCIFPIQMACQMTLVSIGNAKASMFIAILRKIILLIPLIYILPLIMVNNQTLAVYCAEPVADFISVVVTVCVFINQFKKACEQMDRNKALEKLDVELR